MDSLSAKTVILEPERDPDISNDRADGDKYGPTINASGFYITYAIVNEIHGRWEPSNPSLTPTSESDFPYASLIVIRFELAHKSSKRDRRFVSFNPHLRFHANPPAANADPWVSHAELAGKGAVTLSESESSITNERVIELSANAKADLVPGAGLDAGTKWTNTKREEYTRTKRYMIQQGGEKSPTRGGVRGGRDKIWWNATEEWQKGVGDRLQVAVLVRYKEAKPFNVEFTIKYSVDALHSLAAAAKQVSRPFHNLNKSRWEFNPATPNEKVPDGIVPTHLRLAETEGILKKLAFEHSPEKASSITFYDNDVKPAIPAVKPPTEPPVAPPVIADPAAASATTANHLQSPPTVAPNNLVDWLIRRENIWIIVVLAVLLQVVLIAIYKRI